MIGLILGRIINNFPPPQDELRTLLIYLMIVAACYFAVTWGWAVCWAVIGERVSRKTRDDPTFGTIRLGQNDLKDFNIQSLRSHIALVGQTPVLFTGTILENIKYGLPRDEVLSEDEVFERCAAAASEAHCDFLDRLPDGLHTRVGSSPHSQLSGGQKQRITVARALVSNPSLLLLDEFTSALDPTAESVILENLKRSSAASGRTTIIIAHRLTTVKFADQIIVMKDGAVSGAGSHEALVRANGFYAELTRAQQFDKNQRPSATPSIRSNALSTYRENILSPEGSSSEVSLLPKKTYEKKIPELIARCLALSREEAPAIVIGLISSMFSGSLIIREVSSPLSFTSLTLKIVYLHLAIHSESLTRY